eukprot:jgi/Bigna1/74276/fgenesh1_pg.28_\
MERMTLFVHSSTISPTCQSCLLLVAESKLPVKIKVLAYDEGERFSKDFLKLNPYHCVPTLKQEDGFVIWESHTVMRYLCDYFSDSSKEPSLIIKTCYPSNIKARARVNQLLDYRHCKLYPSILKATMPFLGYEAPVSQQVAESTRKQLHEELERFSSVYLREEGKYAGGFHHPTIADFSIVPALGFTTVLKGYELPKRIQAYIKDFTKNVASYEEINKGFILKTKHLALAIEKRLSHKSQLSDD